MAKQEAAPPPIFLKRCLAESGVNAGLASDPRVKWKPNTTDKMLLVNSH